MTSNRNEKKEESEAAHKIAVDVAVMFRQVYEKDAEAANKEVEGLMKRIEQLDAERKKETDSQLRLNYLTHQSFLGLEAAIRHNEVTMKMGFALLASVVAGIDFDYEAKKKQFDDHIAKRLSQIFGDKEKGALYG